MINGEQGVTLLELMIVVAIVGIIGLVAFPSYQEFVRESRRADGQGALMSFAGAMERHFTINDSYCGAGTTAEAACGAGATHKGSPTIFDTQAPVDGDDKYYDLTISAVTPTSFTLQATAINNQVGDRCGNMTITHTGARNAGDTDCWR
ncbi:MAG: type IV pilin protein [Motiliproteus sp.]|nr:type IV pilin protein [Motiliproteus sp.]MCW9052312.1 type IV pilin protein [Motiliproteus sp.]